MRFLQTLLGILLAFFWNPFLTLWKLRSELARDSLTLLVVYIERSKKLFRPSLDPLILLRTHIGPIPEMPLEPA